MTVHSTQLQSPRQSLIQIFTAKIHFDTLSSQKDKIMHRSGTVYYPSSSPPTPPEYDIDDGEIEPPPASCIENAVARAWQSAQGTYYLFGQYPRLSTSRLRYPSGTAYAVIFFYEPREWRIWQVVTGWDPNPDPIQGDILRLFA